MPRATKPALPPAPALPETDPVVAQYLALHHKIEALCFKAADGETLTADEHLTFASAIPDELERTRAIGAAKNIRQAQGFAGTPAERKAVEAQLEAAEQALRERAPAIRERLAALQGELQQLERGPFAPRQRLKVMAEYTARLRDDRNIDLQTPIQAKLLKFRKDHIRSSLAPLHKARDTARMLRTDIETLRDYRQHEHGGRNVGNNAHVAIFAAINRHGLDRNDPATVAAFLTDAQRRLRELDAVISQHEPAESAVMAEIEALCNRHVPQDPPQPAAAA